MKPGWITRSAGISVLLVILLPAAVVVWISFFRDALIQVPPNGYSLRWYRGLDLGSPLLDAAVASLKVALLAASISLVLGTTAAVALGQVRSPKVQALLDTLFLAPLVVPGVVTGLAIYATLFFVQGSLPVTLAPSTWSLVAAHVLVTLPWSYRFISAGLSPTTRLLERASLNLGMNKIKTFNKITLPILRPHMVGASIFSFIFSFANLEISLFLAPPGEQMLPVALMQYAFWKVDPTLAAVASIQMGLVAGLMILAVTLVGYRTVVKR